MTALGPWLSFLISVAVIFPLKYVPVPHGRVPAPKVREPIVL